MKYIVHRVSRDTIEIEADSETLAIWLARRKHRTAWDESGEDDYEAYAI